MAEQVKFGERKSGYDKEEVDEYVRILSEAYSGLYENKEHLKGSESKNKLTEKSLDDINKSFNSYRLQLEPVQEKRSRKKMTDIAGNVFLLGMFLFLVIVICTRIKGETSVMGYHCFHILSGSMRDEYPEGALVLVKNVDIKIIEPGDDITFLIDDTTTVTHRVIEIVDNFDEEGHKGFVTQGVNNLRADEDIVHEANVLGRVVFCIPGAGKMMAWAASNIIWLVLVAAGLGLLVFSVRYMWNERKSNLMKGRG